MAGLKPYCASCRSTYRSWPEHAASDKHRKSSSSVRSSGAAGSQPYRPPAILPRSDAAYDAWLEERALAVMPPTLDELPPVEQLYPDMELDPPRAERGHRPPPCQRCGKTFRTPKGRDWHVTNNPRCEKWAARKARRNAA